MSRWDTNGVAPTTEMVDTKEAEDSRQHKVDKQVPLPWPSTREEVGSKNETSAHVHCTIYLRAQNVGASPGSPPLHPL